MLVVSRHCEQMSTRTRPSLRERLRLSFDSHALGLTWQQHTVESLVFRSGGEARRVAGAAALAPSLKGWREAGGPGRNSVPLNGQLPIPARMGTCWQGFPLSPESTLPIHN